jgi:uncharacterized protein (TIGR03118 family)
MQRRTSLPTLRLRPGIEQLEDRSNPSTAYLATDLISDQPGVGLITDPTLINAWGISMSPTSPFWVSSNGADLSEVYSGDVGGSALTQPFKVTIPGGAPTGQVFNNTGSATDFTVSDGTNSAAAVFLFASEAGMITGWNPTVGGSPPSTTAEIGFTAPDGAIYKGLALATNAGSNFLYAADFHNNKIDVIDGSFQKVTLGTGNFESFTDPNLPAGFAPFNIALIGGKLYVSYAKQDATAQDDVAGIGNGFIDVFETNGHFDQRLVSGDRLNSPWGMVQAPASFGDFSNALLVGNFGDGRIFAYDPTTGARLGTLRESPGHPLVIDGLWGLAFGNGVAAGDATSLYYAAGPADETHGLFGKITANAAGTNPVTAILTGGDLTITGSRGDDHVQVSINPLGTMLVVRAGGQRVDRFDLAAVGTIRFNGLAGNDTFFVDPRVSATVVADGGAGNDLLIGGGGNNILLGSTGNDLLFGGASRDILIGGTGQDHLAGGFNDDILVGGSTTHDDDATALLQILDTWTSSQSYTDRIAAIRAGTGGVPILDSSTVTDDAVADQLFGGQGLDWFFGIAPDVLHGQKSNEQAN